MRGAVGFIAAALTAAALVALPATPGAPATSASAATVDCAILLTGEACSIQYTVGETTVTIPSSVHAVTVLLAGGSGDGNGDDQGAAGPGGLVIATIDTSTKSSLDVWLGDTAVARDPGAGWASGGAGGDFSGGNDGYGGGGASAIAYTGDGHDNPLIVAGGGGGGGGMVAEGAYAGGGGGYGGDPAGSGSNGQGKAYGAGGGGGQAGGTAGAPGTGSGDAHTVGGGGGGGGGGHNGGGGGGAGVMEWKLGLSSGGGGGGGQSFTRDDVTLLGHATAPLGAGWLTIYPGSAEPYRCDDTNTWKQIDVPADVVSYTAIAVGGAGSPGDNLARGGHGGVVTATVQVDSFETVSYVVGCGGVGQRNGGVGYGGGADGGQGHLGGNSGGKGGGATALLMPDGNPLVVAGGGGGAGGDGPVDCNQAPGTGCGGRGGSSGGTPGSALPPNGAAGDGGTGGAGGLPNSHHENGSPSRNGGEGTSSDSEDPAGGGGGGGGGYPMGGGGGHHKELTAGGGGGAGGSYLNGFYADGIIATGGAEGTETVPADGWLLLLPNLRQQTVDLLVQKIINGEAGTFATGPFTMQVECTLDGNTVVDTTFLLDPGGSRTVNAPVGASCTVSETGTGDASTPAPPQTFVVDEQPDPVNMTNTFAATDLTVTLRSQVLGEDGQPTDIVGLQPGQALVVVSCRLDGHELVLPPPVVNGMLAFDANGTFDGQGVSATIPGLPVNAWCRLSPVPGNVSHSEVSVNGTVVPANEAFQLVAGGTDATLLNGYALRPLTISKAIAGTGTVPADAEFGGTASCTFAGNPVTFATPPSFSGLTAENPVELSNLPAFGHCTITETDTAGAAGVSYAPSRTVVIHPTETELEITNTFDAGTLVVTVDVTGPGAAWANQDLTVHVTCTDGTDDTVTLPPGGGVRTFAPDEGATCSVEQTAAGGATSVSYSSSSDPAPSPTPVDVVVGTEPVSLVVNDVFDAAPLDVSVAVSGDGERFADPTSVVASGCTFNGDPIDIAPGAPEVSFEFAPAGGAASIPELVVGAECAVTLAATAGATTASYSVSGGPATVGTTVPVAVAVGGTSVDFTTVFDVGALEVDVALDGPGAWAANVAPVVVVACALDGVPIDQLGPDGAVTLHFEPDGSPIQDHARDLLAELPIGADCVVDETDAGGAATVAYDPAAGVEVAAETTVTVLNSFPAASLTVSKSVGGNDAVAHENEPFTFDVGCTFNGLPIGAPPSVPDQPRSFSLVAGGSTGFDQLPVGAVCQALEIDSRHATSVTPGTDQSATIGEDGAALSYLNTFDVASLRVTEIVTGPGAASYGDGQTFFVRVVCTYPDRTAAALPDGGELWLSAQDAFTATMDVPVGTTCEARQRMQLATTQSLSPPVTILLGQEHDLTITSDYQVGDLRTEKTALGDFGAALAFGFTTECTYPARDWPTQESGLQTEDPMVIPLNGGAAEAFSLRSGDERTVQALNGATCTTTEVADRGALRVDVVVTGTESSAAGASGSAVVLAGIPVDVAVTNFMQGSLPITGAEMRLVALLAGLVGGVLLVAGAIALTATKRRRATTR